MEFTATVVYSQDLFIVVQVKWNDVNKLKNKNEEVWCFHVFEFLIKFFFFSGDKVDAFKVNPTSSYRSKTNVLSYIFQAPKVVEYIRQVTIGTRSEFLSLFLYFISCRWIFIPDHNFFQQKNQFRRNPFINCHWYKLCCVWCFLSSGNAQRIWRVCPLLRRKKKHGKLFFIWRISWHQVNCEDRIEWSI